MPLPVSLPVPAAPGEVSGGLILVTDHLVGRAVVGLAKAGDAPLMSLASCRLRPIEDLAVEQGDRLAQPVRPDVIGQLPEGCGVHHWEQASALQAPDLPVQPRPAHRRPRAAISLAIRVQPDLSEPCREQPRV